MDQLPFAILPFQVVTFSLNPFSLSFPYIRFSALICSIRDLFEYSVQLDTCSLSNLDFGYLHYPFFQCWLCLVRRSCLGCLAPLRLGSSACCVVVVVTLYSAHIVTLPILVALLSSNPGGEVKYSIGYNLWPLCWFCHNTKMYCWLCLPTFPGFNATNSSGFCFCSFRFTFDAQKAISISFCCIMAKKTVASARWKRDQSWKWTMTRFIQDWFNHLLVLFSRQFILIHDGCHSTQWVEYVRASPYSKLSLLINLNFQVKSARCHFFQWLRWWRHDWFHRLRLNFSC